MGERFRPRIRSAMRRSRKISLTSILLVMAFASAAVYAQQPTWETYQEAGRRALERGDYAEAETQLKAALKEASGFVLKDQRLTETLDELASVYRAAGRFDEAETLYRRTLSITEAAFGPEHPNTAASLNNLALLLY